MKKIRIQFVCLGNICRSPLAHAVFAKMVKDAGIDSFIDIESSGTGGWHVGRLPDIRMTAEAARHDVTMDHLGRKFSYEDLRDYDYILVMDRQNYQDVSQFIKLPEEKEKIKLFRFYDPENTNGEKPDVPDPYYGGSDGFSEVYQIVERTCKKLIEEIIKIINE